MARVCISPRSTANLSRGKSTPSSCKKLFHATARSSNRSQVDGASAAPVASCHAKLYNSCPDRIRERGRTRIRGRPQRCSGLPAGLLASASPSRTTFRCTNRINRGLSSNSSSTYSCPNLEATSAGVKPSSSFASRRAPQVESNDIALTLPAAALLCIIVCPRASVASRFNRESSCRYWSKRTAACVSKSATRWPRVRPSLSW
mmetsp:Transcript_156610/g.292293  ORF Transcript_156610/g.292293 Transcript_156610/m.292293 type:complete len:203 (+) Transcript_156610:644-1252(+)